LATVHLEMNLQLFTSYMKLTNLKLARDIYLLEVSIN
jgi:hypothetical protein